MVKIGINRKFIRNLSSLNKMPPQKYDSFLVLDFEATCEEGKRISNPEIIEFPVLKVDGKTFDVTERFHHYVKPVLNPELSGFCTKLTGITQDMVDTSESFTMVFGNFQSWLMEKVGPNERFLFVTCGDWDLKSMLPDQCKRENVILPPYFNTWLNIKKAFAHQTGIFTKGMMSMLKELNIQHVGKHHSGIDDCVNIANILTALNEKGCVFRATAGDKRHHGPPLQPQLAMYAKTGACSNQSSGKASLPHSPSELKDKPSLYPSLSGYDGSNKSGYSSLYEPDDDHSYSGAEKNVLDKDESSFGACKKEQAAPELVSFDMLDKPDYITISSQLKENLLSKNFKSRDQEELQALCVSGKYLQHMELDDRRLVEARLRFFYITLVHGHRVAKKDSRSLSTDAVGIHLDPELVHFKRHHKDKGSRKTKSGHSGGD